MEAAVVEDTAAVVEAAEAAGRLTGNDLDCRPAR